MTARSVRLPPRYRRLRGGGGASRIRHALVVLMVLLLSAGGLTACSGDRALGDFARAFENDPAVESLDLTSHDNQPFTGGVSGEVSARAGLDDAEARELVRRLVDYTAAHGERMQGRVTVDFDGFRVTVTGDAVFDEAASSLVLLLRADARAASAELQQNGRSTTLALRTPTATDAFALASAAPGLVESAGIDTDVHMRVRTVDDAIDLEGRSTMGFNAVARVWEAVSEAVPTTGIRSSDGLLVITLVSETDLGLARTVAATAGAGEAVTVRFASDVVRLGDSDGQVARDMLAALDETSRSRVAQVWASESSLQVSVTAAPDAADLAAPIIAAVNTLPVDSVRLRFDGEPHLSLTLPLADEDRSRWAEGVRMILTDPAVTGVEGGHDTLTIFLGEVAATSPELPAGGARRLVEDGARICLEEPAGTTCVVADDTVGVPSKGGADRGVVQSFVNAWNAEAATG